MKVFYQQMHHEVLCKFLFIEILLQKATVSMVEVGDTIRI